MDERVASRVFVTIISYITATNAHHKTFSAAAAVAAGQWPLEDVRFFAIFDGSFFSVSSCVRPTSFHQPIQDLHVTTSRTRSLVCILLIIRGPGGIPNIFKFWNTYFYFGVFLVDCRWRFAGHDFQQLLCIADNDYFCIDAAVIWGYLLLTSIIL